MLGRFSTKASLIAPALRRGLNALLKDTTVFWVSPELATLRFAQM